MRHQTPAQRLSRTANLVIFLGLLYTGLHLLGGLGVLRGSHWLGLLVALSLTGLGYGIRYGSRLCLILATGLCAGIGLDSGLRVLWLWSPGSLLRLGLSTWACWRLARALPLMWALRHEPVFPLPMSRYGERWLRRRAP